MFGNALPEANMLWQLAVVISFLLAMLSSITTVWDRLRNKKTFVTVEALAETEKRFQAQIALQTKAAEAAEARTQAYIKDVEERLTRALENFSNTRTAHDAALQAHLLKMGESLSAGMQQIAGQIGELKGSQKTLETFASAIAQNMGPRKG